MTGGVTGDSGGATLRPAVFLDRDGVINEDRGYVHDWTDFAFLPGAVAALARLRAAGFALVIVTNQSGIGRGYYTEAAYAALTGRMLAALDDAGVAIDGVHHCPHAPEADCACRKPRPGLIEQALAALPIDRARSIIVGDKPSDIAAGHAAGLAAAYQVGPGAPAPGATAHYPELAACVAAILAR